MPDRDRVRSTGRSSGLGLAARADAARRRALGRLEAAPGARRLHAAPAASCCCSTSRPPASIPRRGAISGRSCTRSPRAASRCWSARTTWTRPSAATSSPTSPTASCWRRARPREIIAAQQLTTWADPGRDLADARRAAARPAGRRADGRLRHCAARHRPRRGGAASATLRSAARRAGAAASQPIRHRPRGRVHLPDETHRRTTTAVAGQMTTRRFSLARWWGDRAQGIPAAAPRPHHLRHDRRHADHADGAVRLRHQHRPEAPAHRGDRRRPQRVHAQLHRGACRTAAISTSSASCPTRQPAGARWRAARCSSCSTSRPASRASCCAASAPRC